MPKAPGGGSRIWAFVPATALCGAFAAVGLLHPVAAVALLASLLFAWIWPRTAPVPPPLPAEPVSAAAPVSPEQLIEQLPDPVILLNERREIIAANRAARDTLGIGLLGRDLSLSLRHPGVLAAVETVNEGVASLSEEITLGLEVTRTFTLHASALPASAAAGSPRVVLVFHDDTRAKKAEQIRADFVANATHELRSPLSAIIGFIETLRGVASDDAAARDRFLAVMQTEAHRMARLVNDLMSLSRVEMNEHVPPRDVIDIADLLDGAASALAMRARQRGMTIEVSCEAPLPPVAGDFDQLTQVLHNLVDNALKYARANTPIRITASAVPRLPADGRRGVAIAVADIGDGIPAIHLPRLTERFYRVDQGRSRRLGGTGLGLAIVKHIVRRHRGRLAIDSEEGRGTTVTVYLPAAAEATDAAARPG